jgi:hypothetical protein
MLTREEYLKKIGMTEEELAAKGLELHFIGEVGYPEGDDGWEIEFKDPNRCVEVGMGCKCATIPLSSVHEKL